MPELPEVETIRRNLEPKLVGAQVTGLWTSGKPLRMNKPLAARELEKACVGRRVSSIRRRAKYLLVDVEGDGLVVVHLGMTGQLRLVPVDSPSAPHTHVVWRLSGGRELRYVDVRRFGSVTVGTRADESSLPELAALGVDPLGPELTPARLLELARASRREVKSFLLDQTVIAGLGNIYVCEALFEAGIDPRARTHRLSAQRVAALEGTIRLVLGRGLANRGTTLRDYVDADGQAGGNQHALKVYGREGEPCPNGCGPVKRVVQQARSTFFCPRCQRRR